MVIGQNLHTRGIDFPREAMRSLGVQRDACYESDH
jgi:hypothetical protein